MTPPKKDESQFEAYAIFASADIWVFANQIESAAGRVGAKFAIALMVGPKLHAIPDTFADFQVSNSMIIMSLMKISH